MFTRKDKDQMKDEIAIENDVHLYQVHLRDNDTNEIEDSFLMYAGSEYDVEGILDANEQVKENQYIDCYQLQWYEGE